MAKFLKVPILDLVANGTTDGDGTATDKLIDSSATFQTDGVEAGDIIHNSTDNTYTEVVAVDSETTLSVSSGEGLDTAKAYFIHSDTVASFKAAISADRVKVVTQASTSTTTLKYGNGGNNVMTLTHVPVANDLGAEVLQDALAKALQLHWNDVSYDISEEVEVAPLQIIGYAIS